MITTTTLAILSRNYRRIFGTFSDLQGRSFDVSNTLHPELLARLFMHRIRQCGELESGKYQAAEIHQGAAFALWGLDAEDANAGFLKARYNKSLSIKPYATIDTLKDIQNSQEQEQLSSITANRSRDPRVSPQPAWIYYARAASVTMDRSLQQNLDHLDVWRNPWVGRL